jgi:hypothetical protein
VHVDVVLAIDVGKSMQDSNKSTKYRGSGSPDVSMRRGMF